MTIITPIKIPKNKRAVKTFTSEGLSAEDHEKELASLSAITNIKERRIESLY